jgi:DNA-directed RNA polymerase subunit K/omega
MGGAGVGAPDKFWLAAVAFLRARQLQNGARPRVDDGDHKPCRLAQLEVMAGLVSWEVT